MDVHVNNGTFQVISNLLGTDFEALEASLINLYLSMLFLEFSDP
jgi:hypothetical protein